MKIIRLIIRLIFVIIILTGLSFLFGLNKILTPSRSREKRRAAIQKHACRWLCWTLGLKVQVKGHPPKPPFILVSNHLSYVDILTLGSCLECFFISKAEVRQWPLVGAVCRLSDTIFIDRKNRNEIPRVNRLIHKSYAAGSGVVFFPEGTSTSGADVKAFKASLLESAIHHQYPVHYATIHYKTPRGYLSARESVCWWGEMKFVPHFKGLLQISQVKTRIHFGSKPLTGGAREELARDLHQVVVQQFIPTL